MKIGDQYTENILISSEHVQKFADFSGDYNPVHFDDQKAQASGFKSRIAHGMVSASLFSKIFATSFPGPGAIYLGQTFKFHAPIYLNEIITYKLEVIGQKDQKPIYTIKTEAIGPDGTTRISGEAVIKC